MRRRSTGHLRFCLLGATAVLCGIVSGTLLGPAARSQSPEDASTQAAEFAGDTAANGEGHTPLEQLRDEAVQVARWGGVRLDKAREYHRAAQDQTDRTHRLLADVLLAAAYQDAEDYDAFDLAMEGLESRVLPQENEWIRVHFFRAQGVERMRKEDFISAAESLTLGLQEADRHELRDLQVDVQVTLGKCMRRLGSLESATEHYQEAWTLAEELKISRVAYRVANNLAYLLLELDRLEEAKAIYDKIPLGQFPEIDFAVRAGYADLAIHEDQATEAFEWIAEAKERADREVVKSFQFGVLLMLTARAHMLKSDWDAAFAAGTKARAVLYEKQPQRYDDLQLVMGEIEFNRGNQWQAYAVIESVAKEAEDVTIRQKAYQKLSELYEQDEDFKRALFANQKAQDLRQALVSQAAQAQIAVLEKTIEYDSQMARMREQQVLANAEKTRSSLQAEQANRNRDTAVTVSMLLMVVAIAYVMISRRLIQERELKELEHQQNRQLTTLVEEKTAALKRELQERADLERSLERKRRTEALGQLTGSVAHDFNNLLQVVMTTNELLLAGELEPRQAEWVDASHKSASTGAAIIRQLLSYARQQTLSPTVISVPEYFEEISGLLSAALGKQCELEICDQSGGITIRVDQPQLTTTLINLLSNAVDAEPRDDKVRIIARRLHLESSGSNQWAELSTGHYLAFDVIDRGTGMSAEAKARAFEPFYSQKTGGRGTGLGLSSAYGFVRQSGGDIQIFDHPEGGTRVTMMFPVAEKPQASRNGSLSNPHLRPGYRILLVEDDPNVGRSIQSRLEQLGYSVELVSSGDQAVTVLTTRPEQFDLLMSDIRMTGQYDGIALRRWARDHAPNLSVILMSGYTDGEALEPDTHFLRKPFTESDLLDSIASAI